MLHDLTSRATLQSCARSSSSSCCAGSDRSIPRYTVVEVQTRKHLIEQRCVQPFAGLIESINQFLIEVHVVRVQIDRALLLHAASSDVTQIQRQLLSEIRGDRQVEVLRVRRDK